MNQSPETVFHYQYSERYTPLIEEGTIARVVKPQICWLVCSDMALSSVVPDSETRKNIIFNLARAIKEENKLDPRGGIEYGSLQDYIELFRRQRDENSLPIAITLVRRLPDSELIGRVLDGHKVMMIKQVSASRAHCLLLDNIIFNQDGRPFFIYLNPEGQNMEMGRRASTGLVVAENMVDFSIY